MLIFFPRSEQGDLEAKYYGVSRVAPTYVLKLLNLMDQNRRTYKVTLFREAFWWSHQDLYVIENVVDPLS